MGYRFVTEPNWRPYSYEMQEVVPGEPRRVDIYYKGWVVLCSNQGPLTALTTSKEVKKLKKRTFRLDTWEAQHELDCLFHPEEYDYRDSIGWIETQLKRLNQNEKAH